MTFDQNDKLNLKPFSEKLEWFLMVDHDFVEGSLVISLNAPFGTGKTTFLSMWKSDIEARRVKNPDLPKVITINAWESDYCGDPLISIIDGLIKSISNDDSPNVKRLHEAAKDVGWFLAGLANNFASHWSGIDPVSAGKLADEKHENRTPKTPDFIRLYESRTNALEKLKQALRDVFEGDTPKAFIFVDELDRCRPDYAINYLETIKHVFDVHGLVFVLAVDYGQLESSAKVLFGRGLNFNDYFRKFVQRTITFPQPEKSDLHRLAGYYVNCYIEKAGKRVSLLNVNQDNIVNVVELVGALRMPPRQIQETFRIIGHTAAGRNEQRGQIHWCLGAGFILMSALKVADSKMFIRLGTGLATHTEVGLFLKKILGKKTAEWWFYLYYTGVDPKDRPGHELLFKELGFEGPNNSGSDNDKLAFFLEGWGNAYDNKWKWIYQKIESLLH